MGLEVSLGGNPRTVEEHEGNWLTFWMKVEQPE
jgi:hypothetical protein